MAIYTGHGEHYKAVVELLVQKPVRVLVATCNIYAASVNGSDIGQNPLVSRVMDALEVIAQQGVDVNMLVGLPHFQLCTREFQKCEHCEERHFYLSTRLLKHVEAWPTIKWRHSLNSHLMRCILAVDSENTIKGIGGARNLTDAEWPEITCDLTGSKLGEIYRIIDAEWEVSPITTQDTVATSIQTQFQASGV